MSIIRWVVRAGVGFSDISGVFAALDPLDPRGRVSWALLKTDGIVLDGLLWAACDGKAKGEHGAGIGDKSRAKYCCSTGGTACKGWSTSTCALLAGTPSDP